MNITLANGQVFNIKNAPEDITQDEVLMALKATDPKLYKMQLNSLAKTGADASQLAKDTGPVDAAMIAAGGATDALGTGIQELYAGLTGDDQEKARLQAAGEERKGIMAPLQAESPVATALGSALPYMAVPVGAAAGAVGKGVGLLGRGVGSQALQRGGQAAGKSLLADTALAGTALGAADQDSSAVEGLTGGLIGHGVGKAASRVVAPITKNLSQEASRVWGKAKKMGFKLSSADKSGSKAGKSIEAGLEASAWTAGPTYRIRTHNQKLANRIAAKSIGEEADSLPGHVLDKVHNRLGDEFEQVASKTKLVKLDDELLDGLDVVEREISDLFHEVDPKVLQTIDNIREKAFQTGHVTGKQAGKMTARDYQRQTRRFASEAKKQLRGAGGDREAGIALLKVQDLFDGAMERSLGKEHLSRFRKAKEQWRNLMRLEDPGVLKEEGNISLASLANTLRRKDPLGFRRGQETSDLYEAARFGSIFKATIGDSGTATRGQLRHLTGMVGGGASTGGVIGSLMGGLPGMAAGAVTGGAVGGMLPVASNIASRGLHRLPSMTQGTRGLIGGIGGRLGASTGGPDEARLRGLLGQ